LIRHLFLSSALPRQRRGHLKTAHQQAIVIRPERKSGTSVWPNLSNKPLVLVGLAIDGQLKLFAPG
jgi:hypothetical protein